MAITVVSLTKASVYADATPVVPLTGAYLASVTSGDIIIGDDTDLSSAFVGRAMSDYINATTPIAFELECCPDISVTAKSSGDANHVVLPGDPIYWSTIPTPDRFDLGPGVYVGRALEGITSGATATIGVQMSPRTAPVIGVDTTYDTWWIPTPPLTNANTALNVILLDGWVPGVAGTILSVAFIPTVASSTEGDIDLQLTIAGTVTTGGLITIEDTTVVGDIIAGSAITAANAFSAVQEINLKVVQSTAALTEGQGYVIATVAYTHDHI
jgi:hypothetical protein